MRAIVCHEYGPPEVVLRCEDVDRPAPRDDEVLLQVRAAGVNPLDGHLMKGKPFTARLMFGLTKPRAARPGRDVAGRVEAVGRGVTRFAPVIDRREGLGAVPQALRDVATRHVRGKVVVVV